MHTCVAMWAAHALLWRPASLWVGKGPGGEEGWEPGSSPRRGRARQGWDAWHLLWRPGNEAREEARRAVLAEP